MTQSFSCLVLRRHRQLLLSVYYSHLDFLVWENANGGFNFCRNLYLYGREVVD
jgi:hypothetical protein